MIKVPQQLYSALTLFSVTKKFQAMTVSHEIQNRCLDEIRVKILLCLIHLSSRILEVLTDEMFICDGLFISKGKTLKSLKPLASIGLANFLPKRGISLCRALGCDLAPLNYFLPN